VRLFGSLAAGAEPHATTDIDLAVDGMDESTAADALLALEAMVDARIDLVRWETAGDRVRRAIERDGVEVGDVTD
jgi:predicted nucleotidyltransferase